MLKSEILVNAPAITVETDILRQSSTLSCISTPVLFIDLKLLSTFHSTQLSIVFNIIEVSEIGMLEST